MSETRAPYAASSGQPPAKTPGRGKRRRGTRGSGSNASGRPPRDSPLPANLDPASLAKLQEFQDRLDEIAPEAPDGEVASETEAASEARAVEKPGSKRGTIVYPTQALVEQRRWERMQLLGGAGPDPAPWETPTTYDALVRAVRARRRGQVATSIPESYRKSSKDLRPGQSIIGDAIAVIANTLTQGRRQFEVIPDDEEDQAEQERAAKLKRWTFAALLGNTGRPSKITQAAGEPWYELGVDQSVADGRGIWELVTRAEAWSQTYGYPQEAEFPLHDADGNPSVDADGDPLVDYPAFNKAGERFQKHGLFPFTLRRVDPLCYGEWKTDGTVTEVIKVEERAQREVWPLYGIRKAGEDGQGKPVLVAGEPYPEFEQPLTGAQTFCLCITYWQADLRAIDKDGKVPVCWVYEVDGLRVDQGHTSGPAWHPLPFFLFQGDHTSLPDPAFQGVSIAFRLMRICDALDSLLSMKLNVAYLYSMVSWVETVAVGGEPNALTGGMAGAAAGGIPGQTSNIVGQPWVMQPGYVHPLESGHDVKPLVPPAEAVQILESLKNDLLEFINLVGPPAAIRGVSPGSGAAGYMVAQLIAAARTKLASILNNAAGALAQMVQFLWWKVEHAFPEGVPVWTGKGEGKGGWLTLKPEDVDGRYSCELSIEPLLPVDELQEAEASLRQQQSGAISMRRHRLTLASLGRFGVDDPDTVEQEIRAERIMNSPIFQLYEDVTAAVRRGIFTPDMANAFVQSKLGIPPAQAAQFAGQGVILGPDGQPLPLQMPVPQPGMPTGQPPVPGVPALPQVPGTPPIAPPPPTNGAALMGMAQLRGAVGPARGMQMQPDLAAQAVGS